MWIVVMVAVIVVFVAFVLWCCFGVSARESRIEEERDGEPR